MKRFVAIALLVAVVGLTIWLINGSSQSENRTKNPWSAGTPVAVRPSMSTPVAASPEPMPAENAAASAAPSPQREPARRVADRDEITLPPKSDLGEAIARKENALRPYRTGAAVLIAGREFDILNLRAIPAADYRPDMGAPVFEKMNYVFVSASAQPFAVGAGFPVVAKRGNGLLAVVTGTVVATLKDAARAPAIAGTHGLELKGTDDGIQTAFYAPKDSSRSLIDVLRDLQGDPEVTGAVLEIVQSRKRF